MALKDFSCSLEHVRNAGRIVTKSDNLPPAYNYYPIGYHGRVSSINVSGSDVERPIGYAPRRSNAGYSPYAIELGPSEAVDYELELAAVIGIPVKAGQRVRAGDADNHIFGFVVLNDWSGQLHSGTAVWM